MFTKMSRRVGKNRPTQSRKRPERRRAWLTVEQLEIREVLTGSISLAGNVLQLSDTGAPAITVAYDVGTNNYTITDGTNLTGSIPGWTVSCSLELCWRSSCRAAVAVALAMSCAAFFSIWWGSRIAS